MVNLKKILNSHLNLFIFILSTLIFIVWIFFIRPKLYLDKVNKNLEQTKTIQLKIKSINENKSLGGKEIKNDKDVKDIVFILKESISMYIKGSKKDVWIKLPKVELESPKEYTLIFLNSKENKITEIKLSQTLDDNLDIYINGYHYDRFIENKEKLFYILENL